MSSTCDLVAAFPTREDVQAALVDLERRGAVDADRIELVGLVDTTEELGRRASDREALRRFGVRSGTGLGVGTLVGAVLGGGAMLVTGVDPTPAAPVAGLIGGGLFGGAAGFFYGATANLPVTEGGLEAKATTDDESAGPTEIVIHLDDDGDAGLVEQQLRDLGAQRVDRRERPANR
jgi:hypothetical protein